MKRGVAGAAFACGVAAYASLAAPPHGRTPSPLRADAALVLSGDVDYLRVRRAAALYAAGAVGAVVVTGAGVGGDSGLELARQAHRAGVPEAAIAIERGSRTTRENLLRAAPLLRERGFRRVALVTSAAHMGRAERAARRALPEVEWLAAPVEDAGPAGRLVRTRLSEWAKLAYYLLRGWA